jgi:hypothetical protein
MEYTDADIEKVLSFFQSLANLVCTCGLIVTCEMVPNNPNDLRMGYMHPVVSVRKVHKNAS